MSLAFNVVNAKARRGVGGVRGSSSSSAASGPRAIKRPHPVPFGKVGEENRGKVGTQHYVPTLYWCVASGWADTEMYDEKVKGDARYSKIPRDPLDR